MQDQVKASDEQVSKMIMDKRRLEFENRSLENEKRYLLAQMNDLKEKEQNRSSRLSL